MVERDIRMLLQSIAIETRKSYAQKLRKLGLYIGQELALLHLWEEEGITQSQLRKRVGTEASTMSNMLKRLEQDDIIYRKDDEADSRVSKVYLTNKGKELQKPIEKIWKQHEEKIFNNVEREDLLLTRNVLQRMSDNLSDTPKI